LTPINHERALSYTIYPLLTHSIFTAFFGGRINGENFPWRKKFVGGGGFPVDFLNRGGGGNLGALFEKRSEIK